MSGVKTTDDGMHFDIVAELYDKYCTPYPDSLSSEIIENSGIQPQGKILEIGSGSGEATRFFVENYAVDCIEPGKNLIELSEKKFAHAENLRFFNEKFEAWKSDEQFYDLILCGQALHWIPKEIRYKRCSELLVKGGHLALFWNVFVNDWSDSVDELATICDKYNLLHFRWKKKIVELEEIYTQEILRSGHFETSVVREIHWNRTFTYELFRGFLSSGAGFYRLNQQDLHLVETTLKSIFERNNDEIKIKMSCLLFLAKK